MDTFQIQDKAREVVEIFKMWGFSKAEAVDVAENMVAEINKTPLTAWANPLKNIGLVVPGNPNWKEPKTDA